MKEILTAWQWDGPVSEPIPYGEGHINQTYAITVTSEQGAKRYILQKINTDTFKDPAGLMENICGVTDFLREKPSSAGLTRRVPRSMWCLPKREGLITKLPMAAAGVSMTLWRILSACSRCSPPRILPERRCIWQFPASACRLPGPYSVRDNPALPRHTQALR